MHVIKSSLKTMHRRGIPPVYKVGVVHAKRLFRKEDFENT